MDAVFLELLNRSLAASWLVLAVLLLRPLTQKAPKNLRCLLWGLAALRLLLPARLKSPLSLLPSAAPISVAPGTAPTVQSGFAAVDAAINPALAGSLAPTPAASADPAQIWLHIGAIIWLTGLAAMLLYTLVSFVLLRRRVADAVLFHDNIHLSDKIDSPFVLGLVFPRIYLPFGLTEDNMALVLAHEQGHLTRHDHWWKPLGFALLALTWFNPLSWLAYVLFCRDIELACDEHVLSVLGPGARKPYSRALLDCSVSHRRIAACPLAFGESDAKGRIKNVLSWKKPTLWVLLAGVLLCAVLAVCFLTDPMEKTKNASAQEALDRIEALEQGTAHLSAEELQRQLFAQEVWLRVGDEVELRHLFTLPDEQLRSLEIPDAGSGALQRDTNAEGYQILRALDSSRETLLVKAGYELDGSVVELGVLVRVTRMVNELKVGLEYPVASLFGLPDAQLSSIGFPQGYESMFEHTTDAEGHQMLRVLSASDEPFELIGEYFVDSDIAATPFTILVQTVRGTMLSEGGSRVDVIPLVSGRSYLVSTLFGLPDEKYKAIRAADAPYFCLDFERDEYGRMILTALQPSDAPFELIGEYFADDGTTVTEIPILVQTVRGTMLTAGGSGDTDDLSRSLDIRYYEFSLDEFTLHLGEEPVELYAYNAAGERVIAAWSVNGDAVSLSGSREDGGITVTPKRPEPGGVVLVAHTDDGLGASVRIYLPEPDAALDIRFYEKSLDEFTVHVGDAPVEVYAVDLSTGEKVKADWSVSDESAVSLELRDYDHCAVIPQAAAAGGVTLTASFQGVTRSIKVYVLP